MRHQKLDSQVYTITHTLLTTGSLDYNLGVLDLDTSSFTHTATYEIQVMIEKDTRFAVSRVLVDVLQYPPPSIEVK